MPVTTLTGNLNTNGFAIVSPAHQNIAINPGAFGVISMGNPLNTRGHTIFADTGQSIILKPGAGGSVLISGSINSFSDLILHPTASGTRIVARKDIVLDNVKITTETDQNLELSPAGDGAVIVTSPMVQTAPVVESSGELTALEAELLPSEFMFYIQNSQLMVMVKIPQGSGSVLQTGQVIAELTTLPL